MKKKIAWITPDVFINNDIKIVPNLISQFEIDWYVFKSSKSKIEMPKGYFFRQIVLNYSAKDPRNIIIYLKIISDILKNEPTILYVGYLGIPYWYPILLNYKRIKNIHVVHAAHNVLPYDGWPHKRVMTMYINYIFRHNKNFQLFSQFLFDYFKSVYKGKSIFYAPWGLEDFGNQTTNNYNIDKLKRNLLFFGNVKSNKKLDLLIDAVKSFPEDIQDKMHLTIAGACDEPEKYYALINECPMISCYFKRIDNAEVPELFLKHDFLVLPYENVAQSGPHMIAYNYNLPVIASNIDGFKERIIDNENGFLFEVNNVDSLMQIIKKAVSLSEDDYLKMKNKLKIFVENNYSQNSIINRYIIFFNSL